MVGCVDLFFFLFLSKLQSHDPEASSVSRALDRRGKVDIFFDFPQGTLIPQETEKSWVGLTGSYLEEPGLWMLTKLVEGHQPFSIIFPVVSFWYTKASCIKFREHRYTVVPTERCLLKSVAELSPQVSRLSEHFILNTCWRDGTVHTCIFYMALVLCWFCVSVLSAKALLSKAA